MSLVTVSQYIIYPAWLSVYASCQPHEFNETLQGKYEIVGKGLINTTDCNSTNKISLYVKDKDNVPILMHEYCHINQFNRGYFSLSCEHRIQKLFSEMECYSIQRYWEIREIFGFTGDYLSNERRFNKYV